MLVSISIFESDHPNTMGDRYIVIAHTAGDNPKELAAHSGIYTVSVH